MGCGTLGRPLVTRNTEVLVNPRDSLSPEELGSVQQLKLCKLF